MRKFTSVLLALVLCAALLCIGAAAADSEDVIEIGTAEELEKIGVDEKYPLNGNYVLTDDINLGGSAENLWNPIEGPNGEAFTGTFDGDGHTISGLYMNAQSAGNQTRGLGLFSYLGSDGTVKNLTVEGEIDPEDRNGSVGGIVGANYGKVINCTSGVDIKNINVETGATIGGVVGNAEGGSTVENCRYTGAIDVTYNDTTMEIGGVVGKASGCTISNCENAGTVKSNIWTGGIVGSNNGGTISNCRNSGIVASNALRPSAGIGGIVGENYGVILDSYNAGTVTGGAYTGGVVGFNVAEDSGATCIVENCYNAGTVSGSGNVGGVAGYNNSSNTHAATVKSSYNTGTVINDGSGNVGGVIGVIESGSVNDGYNTGTVTGSEDGSNAGGVVGVVGIARGSEYKSTVSNCYNTGDVTGSGDISNVGGVVGSIVVVNNYEVTGCFYLKQGELKGIGNGGDSETDVSDLTEDEFADPENFLSLDFKDTWIIDTPSEGGFARPMLRYNLETAEGSGTESDPYIIPDLETLEFYRDMINTGSDSKYNSAHYILTADINLGGTDNTWTPIGSNKDHAFTGTFDGNGHTISELYINSNSEYAGLFGCVGARHDKGSDR